MAVTESTYTGNGSTTNYSFTFPYLKTTDVKASINGTVTTAFTLANATTVQFNSAPANSSSIRIYRETDDSNLQATFYAGSSIRSSDLNDNFTQTLYVSQESNNKIDTAWTSGDETIDSTETWVSNNSRVSTTAAQDARIDSKIDTALTTDVAAGNKITVTDNSPGSGQITVAVTSGSLVNSDINNAAAIAGTKIDPQFGTQNVSVTGNISVSGTVDGRDVSVDGTKLDTCDTGAKDDQTAAEIRVLVESATDSNVFTDDDHTKLNAIEASATADQTAAEIRTLVESASDSNVFTDADHTKLNGIDTGAKDDQTAAEIKTLIASSPLDASHLAANSVTTSEIADAELSTLAGMQSGTASKLASGTTLTADIADLNQVDGLTKQTTISDSDASFPTSGAVVDYVASQIAPLGGLEVIANEDSFPTQPSSGVVISIADAGGIVVDGSGVSTTARTAGNGSDNVTINGFPSTLQSTTLVDNMGLLVSSTGSSNIYNYHKLLGKEDDIKQLSSDINDFKARYRVGSSNPSSDNDAGDLFFNTATDKLLVRNAANNSWDEAQSVGNFYISTLSPAFNGSITDFTITNAPTYASQILLIINGVLQKPNSGTSAPADGFALDGSTVKLGGAPATGSTYSAVVIGSTVNIGTPSDNTVTTAILQNGSCTTDKLGTDAVTGAKIADDAVGAEHIEVLDANLQLADNVKIQVGTGNDLELRHDGTDSRITNNTGALYIDTPSVYIRSDGGSEDAIQAIANGAVNLFHDGTKTFETHTAGCKISAGNLYLDRDDAKVVLGASDDIEIYHDGTNSYIKTSGKELQIVGGSSNNKIIFAANTSNAAELYHDNNKKLNTDAYGINITGRASFTSHISLGDATSGYIGKAVFGDGDDLQIYHDGSDSYINETGTGDLIIDSSHIVFKDGGTEVFETTNSGARFKDSKKLLFGNGNDLEIYHDGSHSYIKDVGSGSLRIDSDSGVLFNTDSLTVNNAANSAAMITSTGTQTILYNSGNARLKTTASGIEVQYQAAATEAAPHIEIDGNGYKGFHWLDNNSYYIGQNSDNRSLRVYSGTDTGDYVHLSAGANSWTGSSDERLKEDIKDIGSVIDKVKDIRCITYKRKNRETPKETIGFIAQDFIGKFDQVLDQSITIKDDDTEYYGIRYTETIPILLKAIQELSAKVAALEAK